MVSCDTWKPDVAEAAVAAGAAIVNDTGGLSDARMVALVRDSGAGAVAMHIEGENPLAVADRVLDAGRPEVVVTLLRARVAELRVRDHGPVARRPRSVDQLPQRLRGVTGGPSSRRSARWTCCAAPASPCSSRCRVQADTHRMLAYLTLSIEYGADVVRVHDVVAGACDLVSLLGRRLGGDGRA